MKKFLTVLLILIASICTAFAFTACDLNDLFGTSDKGGDTEADGNTQNGGSHSGDKTPDGDSTPHTCVFVFTERVDGCVTNGYDLFTCKDPTCGKTEKHGSYDPVGHDYKHKTFAATCTSDWSEADVCSRCGDEKNKKTVAGTKTEHAYEWTETQKATCTADGVKTGKCTACGATQTQAIPSGGHSYGEYKSNNDATCAKDGTKTAECALCGKEDVVTDEGTATGEHVFGEYKSNNDATCTRDATGTAKCLYCNATNTQTIPNSKSEHDYKWTLKEETCTSETSEGVCKNCGNVTELYTIYHDAWFRHDFNWTETHNATCTMSGYRKGTCKKCGMGHTEFFNATGHKAGSNNKCTVCGESIGIHTEIIKVSNIDSTAYGDLGTLYFEMVVLGFKLDTYYNSYVVVYDLYAIQTYTLGGKEVIKRWAVATGFNGDTTDIHNIQLWSVTDQRNVELECILDYGGITATGFRGGGFNVCSKRNSTDTTVPYLYGGGFNGYNHD